MGNDIEVYAGKRFSIVMLKAAYKEYRKADPAQRARCEKWMKTYAEEGPENLDKEKYRFEARLSTGGKDGRRVAVYAFKAWKLRVYGVTVGKRFIATEVDIAKKSDAADQAKLVSAAKRLAPYFEK